MTHGYVFERKPIMYYTLSACGSNPVKGSWQPNHVVIFNQPLKVCIHKSQVNPPSSAWSQNLPFSSDVQRKAIEIDRSRGLAKVVEDTSAIIVDEASRARHSFLEARALEVGTMTGQNPPWIVT